MDVGSLILRSKGNKGGTSDEEHVGSLVLHCAGRKVEVPDTSSSLSGMTCAFPANAANSGEYDLE